MLITNILLIISIINASNYKNNKTENNINYLSKNLLNREDLYNDYKKNLKENIKKTEDKTEFLIKLSKGYTKSKKDLENSLKIFNDESDKLDEELDKIYEFLMKFKSDLKKNMESINIDLYKKNENILLPQIIDNKINIIQYFNFYDKNLEQITDNEYENKKITLKYNYLSKEIYFKYNLKSWIFEFFSEIIKKSKIDKIINKIKRKLKEYNNIVLEKMSLYRQNKELKNDNIINLQNIKELNIDINNKIEKLDKEKYKTFIQLIHKGNDILKDFKLKTEEFYNIYDKYYNLQIKYLPYKLDFKYISNYIDIYNLIIEFSPNKIYQLKMIDTDLNSKKINILVIVLMLLLLWAIIFIIIIICRKRKTEIEAIESVLI